MKTARALILRELDRKLAPRIFRQNQDGVALRLALIAAFARPALGRTRRGRIVMVPAFLARLVAVFFLPFRARVVAAVCAALRFAIPLPLGETETKMRRGQPRLLPVVVKNGADRRAYHRTQADTRLRRGLGVVHRHRALDHIRPLHDDDATVVEVTAVVAIVATIAMVVVAVAIAVAPVP